MKIKNILFVVLIVLFGNRTFAQVNSNSQVYSWNELPKASLPVFKADTFNVVNYGARADAYSLNTKAINDAIADCSRKGGGVVLIPEGIWLSGPIVIKSNVNLHLRRAATLLFTTDKSQYNLVEGIYEGRSSARNQSPISAEDQKNIAITGNGIIDGNGDVWRAVGKDVLTEDEWKEKLASGGVLSDNGKEWYPSAQFKRAKTENLSMLLEPGKSLSDFTEIKDFLRPNLLVLKNCKNVLLEGVTFQNSPAWCLHPLLCEDLTIRNLQIKNPSYAQNGDGIDLESCKNFLIEGCTLSVGDDAICIKSGKDEEGRKRGRPTENGLIRNNTVYNGHGGFVVGSEMSGGARNIFIENCTFIGTDKGLRFKSVRGRGGLVENIYARNIYMYNIAQEAIFFDMFYFVKFATDGKRDMTPTVNEGTPEFRNMQFENIVCKGANKGIFIRGLSEMPIKNIKISNVILHSTIGVEMIDAAGIQLKNVQLITAKSNPVIALENSKNILLEKIGYKPGSDLFLSVSGEGSNQIQLLGNDLNQLGRKLQLNSDVKRTAVQIK